MRALVRFFARYRRSQAPGFLVKHSELQLLQIEGKDMPRLLHSLTTNDVMGFLSDEHKHAQSTLFLDGSGTVIVPVTLFKPLEHSHEKISPLLLQVHSGLAGVLRQHISDYSFEQDIKFEDVSEEFDQCTFFVA